MENNYKKKNGKNIKQGQGKKDKNRKPQKAEKAKKGGRQGKTAISGFSTLSQVAGVPLRRTHHSNLEVPLPKTVGEPRPICVHCSQPIDLIADSFSIGDGFIHFECMLQRIKESETLLENQCVSYLGSGSFGICQKDENGSYTIVKRIEVENKETNAKMKNYVEGLKS